jgi:hypothetical protein
MAESMVDNLRGLVIRPGDKLVIAFNRSLSEDEYREVRDVIRSRMPDVPVLIVEDAAGVAVYRADETPTET